MSNSTDKKDGKSGGAKTSGSKPPKRSRKRQASRPPTIDVEAVRLEARSAKDTTPEKNRKTSAKPRTTTQRDSSDGSSADFDTAGQKPENIAIAEGYQRFGYQALALSAGTGAAASIVLFALVFGVKIFSSDQQNLEKGIVDLSGKISTLNSSNDNLQAAQLGNSTLIKTLNLKVERLATRPLDALPGKNSERINTLEETIVKLPETEKVTDELKGLSDRMIVLDGEIKQAKSAAEKSIRRAALVEEALNTASKAEKGSTAGALRLSAGQNLRLADLEAQVKRLSENLVKLGIKATENRGSPEFKKIVTGLQKDVGKLAKRFQALDSLIDETNKKITTSNAAALKLDQRVGKLEQVDRSADNGRLAALSFAIESLVRKIESGDAFEEELDIVSLALPKNAHLEKLKTQARLGVQSIARLQRQFSPVLRAIVAAEDTPATPGVMGKLIGTAKSLVRIRRVGEIEGNSREAIIARLEARVNSGDLEAALVEAKKLKNASAEAAKTWVQAVQNRLDTIELIKNIRNDVISNLGSGNARSVTKE